MTRFGSAAILLSFALITLTETAPAQTALDELVDREPISFSAEACSAAVGGWSPWSSKAENIKENGCGRRRRTRPVKDNDMARNCGLHGVEQKEDCSKLTKKEKLVSLQYYFVNDVFGRSGIIRRHKRSLFDPSIFFRGDLPAITDTDRCPEDVAQRPVDFLAMVDKSGGMSRRHFRLLLRSVGFLVQKGIPQISLDTTRMALMTFANNPTIEFNLKACDNSSCVMEKLDGAVFRGGVTRMATALDAAQTVFTEESGMRSCSRRVILLITDGSGARYEEAMPQQYASNLKGDKGVEIFAIGVTDLINENELAGIVSTPTLTHLYYMDTVRQTRRIFKRIKPAQSNDDDGA